MKKRKLLSILLTFIMVVSLLPAKAFAEQPGMGLTSLAFAGGEKGYPEFSMSPVFNGNTDEYTVTMPDSAGDLYCNAASSNAGDRIAAFRGTNPAQSVLTSGKWSWLYGMTTGSTGEVYSIHVGTNPQADSTTDAIYKVNIKRSLSLKGLTVNDTLCPDFNKDVLNYTAGIPEDATTASIKATAYGAGYTISINGAPATSGTAAEITLEWDGNGKMSVPITVSGDGAIATTYTLTLIRETKGDTPLISMQPQNAVYMDTEKAPKALRVRAVANGELSYQWYSNSSNSTDGGAAIDKATEDTYAPPISNVDTSPQTTYYYCVITNGSKTITSSAASVTVNPDPTPTVTIVTSEDATVPAEGYNYHIGDTAVTLKAKAESRSSGGTWLYKWKGVSGSEQTITPPTNADKAYKLSCTVTYTLNGVDYKKTSNTVLINVTAAAAKQPTISTQPAGADYLLDTVPIPPLLVKASTDDGGELTYQWCSSTDDTNFEEIRGATSSSYTPESSQIESTVYYRCRITNTLKSISGRTYTSFIDTATATVAFKSAAGLGGNWEGAGTEASPYLIKTQADLITLRDLVNKGAAFEHYYFKLAADITLPADWVPIGALKPGATAEMQGVNVNPFGGIFDGGGFTITVPENGKPLLGYVRHATVKNLNIFGTKIAGYGLVNNYSVDYGPTGSYSGWTASGSTLTVTIDNVTLKSGSRTQKSGFIGGYASGMNVVEIKNSVVEQGVIVGYDKDQTDIGSFASGFNGTIQNCTSSATVYGKDCVGGIIGKKGQSMGPCAVYDCAFTGSVEATGDYAGGIVGSGYNDRSAPQSPCVTIQNCFATGSVKGADRVGGVFGGEGGVKECWPNGIGYIQNNYFSGTVSGSGSSVGGVVGYMQSLNRYNIISNNFYVAGCGATKGIGTVVAVCTPDTPASGSGWTRFSGGIKYGRADDPTGTGADKLAKAIPASSLTDGTLLNALNSGVNSSGDWVNGAAAPVFGKKTHIMDVTVNGLGLSMGSVSVEGGNTSLLRGKTVTAIYSDGTQDTVGIDKATVSGYDTDTAGYKTVTVTYKNHSFVFELYVRSAKPAVPDTISVAFTLLGDTVHSEGGATHTLSGNNLTTWIAENIVSVPKDATVLDVLAKELSAGGYSWMNENVKNGYNGNYIQSITTPGGVTLGEFTNGGFSGWMYTLNGTHPLLGVKQQYLKDGDTIVFHYTDDYTKEEGSGNWGDGGGTTPSGGSRIEQKTVVSGNTATVAISESSITSAIAAIQKSGEKTITVVPTDTGSAANISITISKTAAKSVVDGTKAGIKVETGSGTVTIPNEALVSIVKQASGNDVKISVEKKTAADIPDETIDAQNAVIATITVASNGKAITTFGGERLTVGIPVDSGYTAGQSYKVIILSADGTKDPAAGTCVSKDGKLVVEVGTTHLSTFIVTKEKALSHTFADVSANVWYRDAVDYATAKGLFSGYSDTVFGPEDAMTRAMLVTVLYRMEGRPAVTGAPAFADVQAGQWYTGAVVWAAANKLAEGYGSGLFGANDSITREQLATILYRYAAYKKYDTAQAGEAVKAFSDYESISGFASQAMDWAVKAKLLQGSENRLMPQGPATRAQAAAILMRFCENSAK